MLTDPLLAALAVAGLLVGATGSWSPCGFSMIETLGPSGHTGGRRTTAAACATFAPFAVLGGVLTFGVLALVGSVAIGADATLAYVLAAAVAVAAAVLEVRGTPIVPQVRRQLPVGWRSSAPMPLAAAGYGVLLGLGFTTFILSYGVWALMGVALVLADPLAGVLLGASFGIGRALPIVLLAPIASRPLGGRVCEAMAMRPGLYRGARLGDAVALGLVALVLVGSAGAEAARKEVPRASDPSVAGAVVVYERKDGSAALRASDGAESDLPGSDPAAGGPWIAVIEGRKIVILDRATGQAVTRVRARRANAVAITRNWLAYRSSASGRDAIKAASLDGAGGVGKVRRYARAKAPAQLSAPALEGKLLVYVAAKANRNKLLRQKLREPGRGNKRTLLSTPTAAISAPSIAGKRIAYVHTTRRHQTVRVKGLGRSQGHSVHRTRSGPPTLWSTAIAGQRIYFTVVKRGGAARILSSGR